MCWRAWGVFQLPTLLVNPWTNFAETRLAQLASADIGQSLNVHSEYDFVLPADRAAKNFVNHYELPFRLQLAHPPVPYLGDVLSARVLILAANPGFVQGNDLEYSNEPKFLRQSLESLIKPNKPIYYLDQEFRWYVGHCWWLNLLRFLFTECYAAGLDHEKFVSRVACLQWLPYHSNLFPNKRTLASQLKDENKRVLLPSQTYTLDILKLALQKNHELPVVAIYGDAHAELWEESYRVRHVNRLPAELIRLNSSFHRTISRKTLRDENHMDILVNAILQQNSS